MSGAYVARPIALLVFCYLFAWLDNPAAQVSARPVMTGLDNPRGLAVDRDGTLYVAEAGKGGSGPCLTLRGQSACFGRTGAVSRLREGRHERYVTGLPSHITTTGEVTGPHDVGIGRDAVYVVMGMGGNPAEIRAAFGPDADYLGKLLIVTRNGLVLPVELSAYESTHNPAGGPVDSNPFGLLVHDREGFVADAGANAVLRLGSGQVSTLAALLQGPRPFESVPTTIVRSPDGAFYIGELTGVPFPDGAARVYRVTSGGVPQVFLEGFKTIIDLAFGPDGSLYVLEHASGPVFFAGPGRILRVAPNGSRSVVLGGLDRPTSIAIDRDGAVFVTNHGISIGSGEVLRIGS